MSLSYFNLAVLKDRIHRLLLVWKKIFLFYSSLRHLCAPSALPGQASRLCVIFFLWGGELILSGILVEEADEWKGAFLKFPDLELVEETMKEERIGVLLKKSI